MGIALGLSAALLLLIGINPILAFSAVFSGSIGTPHGISETLIKTTPLLLTALAFTLPYRAGFMNIGGEGQLFMGALAAFLTSVLVGDLPSAVAIPLIFLTAFLAGLIWIILPLIFKFKAGVSEIFITVILNFIAILFIGYLTVGPLKAPGNPNPETVSIPIFTELPKLFPPLRLHAGVFIPIIAAFLIYILFSRTSIGYKIRVIGLSSRSATYAGIKVSKVVVIATFIGAGLAGLAGAGEVLGIHHFLTGRLPVGLGYTGILVAVLGRFNPISQIPASIFFAAWLVGGETMQRMAGVPYGMIFIIISLITFLILATERIMESWR